MGLSVAGTRSQEIEQLPEGTAVPRESETMSFNALALKIAKLIQKEVSTCMYYIEC